MMSHTSFSLKVGTEKCPLLENTTMPWVCIRFRACCTGVRLTP